MRHGIAGLALVICVLGTWARLPAWRSDLTLWGSAVQTAPALPRPALNYGMALIRDGQPERAVFWLVRAGELARQVPRRPRVEETVVIVRHGLQWLDAFGIPACHTPAARSFC